MSFRCCYPAAPYARSNSLLRLSVILAIALLCRVRFSFGCTVCSVFLVLLQSTHSPVRPAPNVFPRASSRSFVCVECCARLICLLFCAVLMIFVSFISIPFCISFLEFLVFHFLNISSFSAYSIVA